MSTRGAIARVAGDGFIGRYHHFDAYPSGLGKTLYGLYHGHFEGDLEKMLEYLIDKHEAGWSTINETDFNAEAGFNESGFKSKGPKCYCHGGRNEKGWDVDSTNASASGVEWVYAFNVKEKQMFILSSYCDPKGENAGSKMIGMFGMGDPDAVWKIVRVVELKATEPDWETIEERG